MQKENNKIWGLYTTVYTNEYLDKLSEIDIWKKIDNLGRMIYLVKRGILRYRKISKNDLEDMEYNLEYLVYYTRRFGVTFQNEPTISKHIEKSASFKSWYMFWYNHFDLMDNDTYESFLLAKKNNLDISIYLPKISWKEHEKILSRIHK